MNDKEFAESVLDLAEFISFNAKFAEITQNLDIDWDEA